MVGRLLAAATIYNTDWCGSRVLPYSPMGNVMCIIGVKVIHFLNEASGLLVSNNLTIHAQQFWRPSRLLSQGLCVFGTDRKVGRQAWMFLLPRELKG